jgi:hypothetical protein
MTKSMGKKVQYVVLTILEPGRVSVTRKRQLRSVYGVVVVITRVCQME